MSGLHLRDESETQLSAPIASEVGDASDVTRISVLAGPHQALELGLLIAQVGEQALERDLFGVSDVDTDADQRTFSGRAAWWRASLLLEGGAAQLEDDQETGESASGGVSWHTEELQERALWLQPRWRLGRVSVQTAVRHQRMKSDRLTRGTTRHDELLPRLALAWDPMGDGQWNLFVSATESSGAKRGSRGHDTARRYSLGLRHQLLPGLVIDLEAEQRLFESDDRAEKLARDWLRPWHLLARCARRQQGARLGVHARLGSRFVAGFDYDYSETETAQPCPLSGSADMFLSRSGRYLIGTPEPLLDHLHRYRWLATLKLENGLEAGATLRLSDGIAPRIRTEQVSPDRFLVSSLSSDQKHSLTQLDLALGYRWQVTSSLGRNTMGITARLELLNALGGDATLTYLPQNGDAAPQPLTAQAPRQLWLGIRLEL